MRPGDRLVCAFVEPLSKGTLFEEWPLHVTIVPWFRLEKPSNVLAGELAAIIDDLEPFMAVSGKEAGFGFRGRKKVNLIVQPTPFNEIERRVRLLLRQNDAWLVDETTKTRHEYRPHITVQAAGGLPAGQGFLCNRLYIIEQKGDHKEVAASISLRDRLGK